MTAEGEFSSIEFLLFARSKLVVVCD